MLPSGVDGVVGRKVVQQLDVAGQADADEQPLEQVVAQQAIRREPVRPARP